MSAESNATPSINRLPAEILVAIFAQVPKTQVMSDVYFGPDVWPFEIPNITHLAVLLRVCRHWRAIALETPSLWSTYWESPDHRYDGTAVIPHHDASSVPLDVYATGTFSTQVQTLLRANASRVRQLHIVGDLSEEGEKMFRSWLAKLDTNALPVLEHCSVTRPSKRAYAHLASSPFFGAIGRGLRSLLLNVGSTLPRLQFPNLTRLVLCGLYSTTRGDYPDVDARSLLELLSGTPRLEAFYLRNLHIVSTSETIEPLSLTTVVNLRQFSCYGWWDVDIASLASFLSHLVTSPSIRIEITYTLWTPRFLDKLAGMLQGLPGGPSFTKMCLHLDTIYQNSTKVHMALEVASTLPGGTTTICLEIRDVSIQDMALWHSFTSSPLIEHVESFGLNISGACEELSKGFPIALSALSIGHPLRTLTLAIRRGWADEVNCSEPVRRLLEPLCATTDGFIPFPALDSLSLYLDNDEAELAELLEEVLAPRARTVAGVERIRLFLRVVHWDHGRHPPGSCAFFPSSRVRPHAEKCVFVEHVNVMTDGIEEHLTGGSWHLWPLEVGTAWWEIPATKNFNY